MSNQFPFRLENLVVLQYASNNCYVNVADFMQMSKEGSLGGSCMSVDLQKGTWSYREYRDKKIGEARVCGGHGNRSGVIGVYDRTNTSHLDCMAHAAIEAVREYPPFDE